MFAVLYIADFALHAVLRTETAAGAVAQMAVREEAEPNGELFPFPANEQTLSEPNPAAADLPAALFDGAKKKSLLLAVNAAARAKGVELGMTAPQAVARCPDLLIRTPKPEAENEARAALLAVGFTVSPHIEDTSPGLCTIDLRGMEEGRYLALAEEAVAQLESLALPAAAGIARTPLLASYAAQAAHARQSGLQTGSGAKDLSQSAVSSFTPVFKIAEEKTFLGPLPLAVADPSPMLSEVLANWGLRTLGDLTALPRDEIVRRFGAEGLALWQRASGGSPRPLRLVAPAQTFSAEMEFEDEIETLEPLLFILRRFIERLTLELRTAQQVAVELALTLKLEDETQHARQFRLPEPTGDAEILFRALHTHLESLRTESPVSSVHLHLVPARPLVRQQDLFETGLRDPHGFAETLARVVAIVGSDRVGTPQLEETFRPDAFKLISPLNVIPPPAEPPVHAPTGLPLRRFRPPLPAKLELSGDVPTFVWTEQFHGTVLEIRGPWRSSGDWWEKDRLWARVEWDIALAEGGLYRLIFSQNAYFVEGEYD